MDKKYWILIYVAVMILMTIVTFFLYRWDKKKAEKGKWRTKEKTLLLSSFLFGSIGGILGMYINRHKNNKWYFILVNFGSLLIHIAGLIVVAYFTLK